MKLLFVHDRFGAWAGAEANVHWTANELGHRGHQVGLLHGPGTGRGEDGWRATFAQRYDLAPDRPGSTAHATLQEFGPDVVYLHKMSDLEVIETLAGAPAPVVRMVHDHDLYCLRSYKYHALSRRVCTRPASWFCLFPCGAFLARNRAGRFPVRWVSYRAKRRELRLHRRFSRLVVASQYMRAELLRNGFDARRIEIHAPVPGNTRPAQRSSFNDRNLILYAGQIIRGKGVDVLLQALARVRTPFECVILGDGSHRPACEALTRRLGLADRVQFRGFVPQAALDDYYRQATLMALSSVWPEPFGAVGLEGMRHGLPVVAFDAGGIKEWLTDGVNGFLVPWMDHGRFAACIETLLDDKSRARRMGECGRQRVAEHFDFSRYVSDLETMFEQVRAEAA